MLADDGSLGKGKCNGVWSLISLDVVEREYPEQYTNASENDKNGNHYVCWKMNANGVYQYKDDRPIK